MLQYFCSEDQNRVKSQKEAKRFDLICIVMKLKENVIKSTLSF